MGSVVDFPDRRAFNADDAPLTTADRLHIVGLDRHFQPVFEGEETPWWGTIGIWEKGMDTLNVRLSAAFLDREHAVAFTTDIATAGDQMIFEGMDDDMIADIQNALMLKELSDFEGIVQDDE